MSIKKDFFAPLASGLGATRRATMLLLVMMLTTAMAWANDGVKYIDMDGNEQTVTDYTEVTESMTAANTGGDIEWVSGTYVVKNNVTLDGCIKFYNADINLIVCDGAKLTVIGNTTNGAFLGETLNIYAQSNGTGMGEVEAQKQTVCYHLNIAGGKVTLDAGDSPYGLYIYNSENSGLTMNGGDVTIRSNSQYQGTIFFEGSGFVTLNGGNLAVTNNSTENSYKKAILGHGNNTLNFNGGTAEINGMIRYCQNINLNGGNVTVNGEIENSSYGYTVTYDFTSASDRYYIQAFSNDLDSGKSRTVQVKDGKSFLCDGYIYFGTLTDEQIAAISSQTMSPDVSSYSPISVNYIDKDGVEKTHIALPLQGGEVPKLTSGWYVVNDDVEYTGKITLDGDVNIILADGKTMTVTNTGDFAIYGKGRALHIYGQSQGTGALTATAVGDIAIFIGADDVAGRGCFLGIHGGVVTASASNSIGIGVQCATDGSGIVISGGQVMATGSSYGIYCEGGHFDILGGQVTANGGLSICDYFVYDDEEDPEEIPDEIPGVLTLGCSKATDFISTNMIDNYEGGGEVKIASEQTLVDNNGNIYDSTTETATLAALKNVTLRPVVGVTLTKDGSGNISAVFDGTSLETVSIPENVTVNSVIYNRTFTPGKPSTVMLPFNYTCDGNEGGTFYTFGGVQKVNNKWEATMNEVGSLTANTPYLFKPEGTTMTFTGGAILNTTGGGNCVTAETGSHWKFKGTYEYKEWQSGGANADEIGHAYGFAGVPKSDIEVGDFVMVDNGAKIRPMCCYLLWSDTPNAANARALTRGAAATEEELPQSITVRLVGSNGETTGIGTLDTKTGEMTFDSEAWYTPDGVRLSGKPTMKGLYINNGRKIVIK